MKRSCLIEYKKNNSLSSKIGGTGTVNKKTIVKKNTDCHFHVFYTMKDVLDLIIFYTLYDKRMNEKEKCKDYSEIMNIKTIYHFKRMLTISLLNKKMRSLYYNDLYKSDTINIILKSMCKEDINTKTSYKCTLEEKNIFRLVEFNQLLYEPIVVKYIDREYMINLIREMMIYFNEDSSKSFGNLSNIRLKGLFAQRIMYIYKNCSILSRLSLFKFIYSIMKFNREDVIIDIPFYVTRIDASTPINQIFIYTGIYCIKKNHYNMMSSIQVPTIVDSIVYNEKDDETNNIFLHPVQHEDISIDIRYLQPLVTKDSKLTILTCNNNKASNNTSTNQVFRVAFPDYFFKYGPTLYTSGYLLHEYWLNNVKILYDLNSNLNEIIKEINLIIPPIPTITNTVKKKKNNNVKRH